MNASKQASELVAKALGHDLFKVRSSSQQWSYLNGQNCEWLTIEVGGVTVPAKVLLSDESVEFQWFDEIAREAAEVGVVRIRKCIGEAVAANNSLEAIGKPRFKRAFIFDMGPDGFQWGLNPEEWGPIEPFMSVRI